MKDITTIKTSPGGSKMLVVPCPNVGLRVSVCVGMWVCACLCIDSTQCKRWGKNTYCINIRVIQPVGMTYIGPDKYDYSGSIAAWDGNELLRMHSAGISTTTYFTLVLWDSWEVVRVLSRLVGVCFNWYRCWRCQLPAFAQHSCQEKKREFPLVYSFCRRHREREFYLETGSLWKKITGQRWDIKELQQKQTALCSGSVACHCEPVKWKWTWSKEMSFVSRSLIKVSI